MTALKLGFIGGARESVIGQTHYAASRLDGRWQLAAGAFSRDPHRNRDTAAAWGVADDGVYDDWRQLVESAAGKLDAVAILTPTSQHIEMVTAALLAKVPVICEKPLATSMVDAQKIVELQAQNQGFLAVTYNYNAYPMLRELRARIAAGHFGELWHVVVEMPQSFLAGIGRDGNSAALGWRIESAEYLPSVLTDLGSHAIDMARFVSGQSPTAVFAELSNHNEQLAPLPDNAHILLRHDSALRTSIWSSGTASGNRHGMNLRVHGSSGGASWQQEHPEQLNCADLDGRQYVLERGDPSLLLSDTADRMTPGHPAGFIEGFANLYNDIADNLERWQRGDTATDWLSTAEQSVAGLGIMEAAVRSSSEGRWVDM